jgi:hypothetical protein
VGCPPDEDEVGPDDAPADNVEELTEGLQAHVEGRVDEAIASY